MFYLLTQTWICFYSPPSKFVIFLYKLKVMYYCMLCGHLGSYQKQSFGLLNRRKGYMYVKISMFMSKTNCLIKSFNKILLYMNYTYPLLTPSNHFFSLLRPSYFHSPFYKRTNTLQFPLRLIL